LNTNELVRIVERIQSSAIDVSHCVISKGQEETATERRFREAWNELYAWIDSIQDDLK